MGQYTIEHIQLSDICGRFTSISQVMDRNTETLNSISGDTLEGMGREAQMLRNWAAFCGNRKDDIRRVSECLQNASSVLRNGERAVHGLLSNVDVTAATGGIYSGDYSQGEYSSGAGTTSHYSVWDNSPSNRSDWSSFTPVDWRRALPFFSVIPAAGIILGPTSWIENRRLFFRNRDNAANETEGTNEQGTGDSTDCISPDVATGCGVIDLDEDEFADAESEVNTSMGAAEGTAIGTAAGAAGGMMAGAGVGGRGSGSGGRRPGSSMPEVDSEIETGAEPEIDSEIETVDDIGANEIDDTDKTAEKDGQDGSAFTASTVTGAGGTGGMGNSSAATSGNTGAGSGVSPVTPIIGAASVGSAVASGALINEAKKIGKHKAEQADQSQPEPPIVAAKEGNGIFAGNLSSEYVLFATTFSLLFAGASVAAAAKIRVKIKGKKEKAEERFKIGYGVSAILCSGEIQV